MKDILTTCSHCKAQDSIIETLELFYCNECGWWGMAADKLVHSPESFRDEDFRQGQVPKRPSC